MMLQSNFHLLALYLHKGSSKGMPYSYTGCLEQNEWKKILLKQKQYMWSCDSWFLKLIVTCRYLENLWGSQIPKSLFLDE